MNESLTIVRPNGADFSVDMTEIRRLEARQGESAGVGRFEALGLMNEMKEGYTLTGEARARIGLELDRARIALKTRKAVVCIDLLPSIMQSKGLATTRSPLGSAEQREDVLQLDDEYQKLLEYIAQLEAARELFHVKMESFRMTYSTVKRNFDETLGGISGRNYNGGALPEPRPAREFLPAPRQPSANEIMPGIIPPSPTTAPASGAWTKEQTTEDFGILIGKARY